MKLKLRVYLLARDIVASTSRNQRAKEFTTGSIVIRTTAEHKKDFQNLRKARIRCSWQIPENLHETYP